MSAGNAQGGSQRRRGPARLTRESSDRLRRQQLAEAPQAPLLLVRAAVAERHRRKHEAHPAPARSDGRRGHGVELAADLRVQEKRVHLRDVGEGGVGEGLVKVSAVLSTNLLGQGVPVPTFQQLEVRLVLGVDPDLTLGAPELHVRRQGLHRMMRPDPVQVPSGSAERGRDHAQVPGKGRREGGHPCFPHSVDREIPCQAVERPSAAEAALLAGMLPNPRFFDPLKRLDKAKARQDRVLFNMFQAKLLTEDEYGAAQTAPLALRTGSSGRFDLSALAGRNGRPCYQKILEQILLDSYSDHALYRQGIKVRTTLDKDLQERLCSWMREEHDNGGTAADHVAAAVRPPILVVKEGGQIRAIVCVRNAEAARLLLDSLNPREREYEVEEVLFSSIMMDDIIVSVETVGDGQELQTGR